MKIESCVNLGDGSARASTYIWMGNSTRVLGEILTSDLNVERAYLKI